MTYDEDEKIVIHEPAKEDVPSARYVCNGRCGDDKAGDFYPASSLFWYNGAASDDDGDYGPGPRFGWYCHLCFDASSVNQGISLAKFFEQVALDNVTNTTRTHTELPTTPDP